VFDATVQCECCVYFTLNCFKLILFVLHNGPFLAGVFNASSPPVCLLLCLLLLTQCCRRLVEGGGGGGGGRK
jgi:hypothetical protein